ncbi:membrane protein [Paenibacillus darwinianus]|uniref:UPF0756 membrane protein BG53_05715 n=1 Tax=Paenibacillus darwinianus TaxID=1380763 RepID=A0A9W5S0G5_9BACL|nr:DUF441 domain-containing protein [Paenibacillus darwinianus]EXX86675.1 membrane protein [Paenibacillus darwinianus]EXX86966.1 membrane protein [Paenibacillus darwinianus]EXX91931.1 membrane protein [Paenibacillus darwinianus]
MSGEVILVVLIVVGLIGRSPIIATAACILLIVKLVHLERYLPAIERRGLEFGLLCLTFSVLVPFASGRIQTKEIAGALTSWPGWIALAGGAIATYVNGKGLEMLKFDPQLIVGLVIGSILGIVFFRGIPVGPLMAAGITAILYKLLAMILDRIN